MEFGIQFFPDIGPKDKSAAQYFHEALKLVDLCDDLGYSHVRTVEHYFEPYGGYTPNPLLFLTACAARTRKARLVVGAVLPAFNHPLKIAGEAGMLDSLSGGRLELGFARAFLPHEFERFGISVDESVARFDEGVDQVTRLLEKTNVTCSGRFHGFKNVTSLPRPVQKPIPYWTAALGTPASFEKAGRAGHSIMAIPMAGGRMRDLIRLYRESWRQAGHPGHGRVMMAFHMFCHEDRNAAMRIAKAPLERYLKSLVSAAAAWTERGSPDYPGYDRVVAKLAEETFESQLEANAAWVGTPDDIAAQIRAFDVEVNGFEIASMQVNFNTIGYDDAARSMRLFGREIIPRINGVAKPAAAE